MTEDVADLVNWCVFSDQDERHLNGITVFLADDPEKSALVYSGSESAAELPLADVFLSELLFYEGCAASCAEKLRNARRFCSYLIDRMERRLVELGCPPTPPTAC